jgi:hypothetical protein
LNHFIRLLGVSPSQIRDADSKWDLVILWASPECLRKEFLCPGILAFFKVRQASLEKEIFLSGVEAEELLEEVLGNLRWGAQEKRGLKGLGLYRRKETEEGQGQEEGQRVEDNFLQGSFLPFV